MGLVAIWAYAVSEFHLRSLADEGLERLPALRIGAYPLAKTADWKHSFESLDFLGKLSCLPCRPIDEVHKEREDDDLNRCVGSFVAYRPRRRP